jgi:hypothetical protein
VDLEVRPPALSQEELVARFVRRPDPLTVTLRQFLDIQGNANGGYDLGDVRAYLQANPDLPEHPAPVAPEMGSFPLRSEPEQGGGP